MVPLKTGGNKDRLASNPEHDMFKEVDFVSLEKCALQKHG